VTGDRRVSGGGNLRSQPRTDRGEQTGNARAAWSVASCGPDDTSKFSQPCSAGGCRRGGEGCAGRLAATQPRDTRARPPPPPNARCRGALSRDHKPPTPKRAVGLRRRRSFSASHMRPAPLCTEGRVAGGAEVCYTGRWRLPRERRRARPKPRRGSGGFTARPGSSSAGGRDDFGSAATARRRRTTAPRTQANAISGAGPNATPTPDDVSSSEKGGRVAVIDRLALQHARRISV